MDNETFLIKIYTSNSSIAHDELVNNSNFLEPPFVHQICQNAHPDEAIDENGKKSDEDENKIQIMIFGDGRKAQENENYCFATIKLNIIFYQKYLKFPNNLNENGEQNDNNCGVGQHVSATNQFSVQRHHQAIANSA